MEMSRRMRMGWMRGILLVEETRHNRGRSLKVYVDRRLDRALADRLRRMKIVTKENKQGRGSVVKLKHTAYKDNWDECDALLPLTLGTSHCFPPREFPLLVFS